MADVSSVVPFSVQFGLDILFHSGRQNMIDSSAIFVIGPGTIWVGT